MKEKELNLIDRFLIKIILCFIILLGVVIMDCFEIINYDSIKSKLSSRINILNIVESINGENSTFIPIQIDKDQKVDAGAFAGIENINNGYLISLGNYEAVEAITMGVVVKITRHDNGTFSVVVMGADNLEYTYDKLTSLNVNIYTLLEGKQIIGKANSDGINNYYKLYVSKEGKYINYYNDVE